MGPLFIHVFDLITERMIYLNLYLIEGFYGDFNSTTITKDSKDDVKFEWPLEEFINMLQENCINEFGHGTN